MAEGTDSLVAVHDVEAVYTKDQNALVADRNDSNPLLPYSVVGKVESTAVALYPNMVHLGQEHYLHIQLVEAVVVHHKNMILRVMMLVLTGDRDEAPHDMMNRHRDCQSYLFRLGLVNRLERVVQSHLRYHSAIRVCFDAKDYCMNHHSVGHHYCNLGGKNTSQHLHYRYYPHGATEVVPSLPVLTEMHLQ